MLPDRKLNRLKNYDYGSEGQYFITSCIQSRDHWFGEVLNSEMHLNAFGTIADLQFEWLQNQYPYVAIHTHIVMPNHVLAIIEIVAAGNQKIKSISELMGAYKTTTTKKIRQAGLSEFIWQRSFHDHIIRDERGFQNIYQYIKNNPANWQQDKFFTP